MAIMSSLVLLLAFHPEKLNPGLGRPEFPAWIKAGDHPEKPSVPARL